MSLIFTYGLLSPVRWVQLSCVLLKEERELWGVGGGWGELPAQATCMVRELYSFSLIMSFVAAFLERGL